jgi:glycosyltransferase involved in cell wall biosynthesis
VTHLRILFVCGADFSAPGEKLVLGHAAELTRRGHEVAVALGGDPGTLEPAAGRKIEGLRVWRHGTVGRTPASKALREAMAFAPTVVHAFTLRHPVVCAARAYGRSSDAPVFSRIEDDEWGLAEGRPNAPVYRRAGRRVLKLASRAHAPLWPFATKDDFAWAKTEAVALDAVTPVLAEYVTATLERPCTPLLPPMPQAAPPPDEAPLDLPDRLLSRPLVAYAGAVYGSHEADFRLGLEALAELHRRGEDVGFAHAGRVAPRFDLAEMAAECGVPREAVHVLGDLTPGPLNQLLRRADVLIQPGHPSSFNRLRLPTKLQVYLASGTPTVTFAVGAGELFEDRVELLKTYGASPSELADRIAEALHDEDLRRTLSAGGPRAVERLFDTERNTQRLLDHYAAALAAPA